MGGNLFLLAEKINKKDIPHTTNMFIKEIKNVFPNAMYKFDKFKYLGSTFKKEYSGDIDLGFDSAFFSLNSKEFIESYDILYDDYIALFNLFKSRARTSTDEQLQLKSFLTAIGEKINEKSNLISVNISTINIGSMYTSFPQYINDKKSDKIVQIDLMIGNIDWIMFTYYSENYDLNLKGLHRTQLLLSMYSHMGYTFNHLTGIKDKNTNMYVAKTPNEAIALLNKLYNTSFTIDSVKNFYYILHSIPIEHHNQVIDIYLKILDKTRCDIPYMLHQYWIKNQERLCLTGNFLPNNSKLKRVI